MKKSLLLLLFLLSFQQIKAQDNKSCPCCTEEYNVFDFWIGDWTVYDVDGKVVGKNTIKKQYGNCVLQEKWISAGISRGTSYNFYDKTDNTWNQIWIDNSGFNLALKGSYIGDKMILKSNLLEGKDGKYYNQITWKKNEDGSVTQTWDIFNESHQKKQEAFKGFYKKSVKTSGN